MASGLQPVRILGATTQEERGEQAQLSSFVGAIVIADLVKTTLGPRGMDKILQSQSTGEIQVTNDGATILGAIPLDNPAAKILVNISKTQDNEVGDGTTSVCVLAGELLREADRLVQTGIHPQVIIAGWRRATKVAYEALVEAAVDNGKDDEKMREDLLSIARTTLSSKIVHTDKGHFAQLCVDAVMRLNGSTNLEAIHIIKKQGGSLRDSTLAEGFILEKKIGVGQPRVLERPKVLLANTAMDTDKNKIYGLRVRTDSAQTLANIEEAERNKMLAKCEKIAAHKINCFINRQLIYNLPEQFFASHGIMAIEHADFAGIERLALVLGGEIVSTFDHPEKVRLGTCERISEIMIGEDTMIHFSGCAKAEACTIVLRGASQHLLDEAERSLHDALCVLSQARATETRTVLGAGASELLMAERVDALARGEPSVEAIAMRAFARALRQIPTILADNAGYDSRELVTQLTAEHHKGNHSMGLDMKKGTIGDARELGVIESFKVKKQVLLSGVEAAECVLRVDEIVRQAPRQRNQERHM